MRRILGIEGRLTKDHLKITPKERFDMKNFAVIFKLSAQTIICLVAVLGVYLCGDLTLEYSEMLMETEAIDPGGVGTTVTSAFLLPSILGFFFWLVVALLVGAWFFKTLSRG